MNAKLMHLKALADSAHAELRHVADDLRESRDRYYSLDRHRQNIEAQGYHLSAPDAHRHAELAERIDFLAERHAEVRSNHKARRKLAERCEEVSDAA